MVPGMRRGPFCPDNGLDVDTGSNTQKKRPWCTPSLSAEFALLPCLALRTKNRAAMQFPRPASFVLSVATIAAAAITSPAVGEGREGEEDIFSEIVKNN